MSFNNIKTLGKAIKQRRKQLQMTQPDLAQLVGISVNTLYKIETGSANPTFNVIARLLDVLGLQFSVEIKQIE